MEISETLSVISFMITVVIRTTISKTTIATEIFGETDGCPVNTTWTPKSQSCYLHLKEKLNFTQAKESCKEFGSHLVFIGNEKENKYIQSFTGNGPLWIGLYRPTNEICAGSSCGNWIWLDGSVPQYSQWAEGVGENSNQCAFMDSAGGWDNGRSCSAARTYVCEQKRIFPSTAQEPSTIMSTSDIIRPSSSDAFGCPVNTTWTPESLSCYLLLTDKLNFTKAKESCKELGAHLVFIDSEKENKYIQSFTGNGPLWIGLYRPTNKICAGSSCGNWMWLNGSVPQYSQWAEGVGNNSNQCAFMDSAGDWDHGRSSSAVRTYVCEQKRIFPSTTQEPSTIMSTSDIIRPSSSDAFAAMDSPVANDDSITYIGVGVSTAIIAISVVVGLGVFYMKTRRGENRDPQANSRISNKWGYAADTEAYENCGHGALANQPTDQLPTNRKAVPFNTLSGTVEDTHASTGAENKEDNSAYEEIKNYSEVNPEYTRLQVSQSADTQHETNAFYANVVHH